MYGRRKEFHLWCSVNYYGCIIHFDRIGHGSGQGVSDNGRGAFLAVNHGTLVPQILVWTENDGLKEITDETTSIVGQFSTPKISSDGNYVVFCEVVTSDALFFGALRVHIPSEQAEHEFTNLLETENDSYCGDSPGSTFIDSNGFVHVYGVFFDPIGADLMPPQILVVDPRMNPIFDGLGL